MSTTPHKYHAQYNNIYHVPNQEYMIDYSEVMFWARFAFPSMDPATVKVLPYPKSQDRIDFAHQTDPYFPAATIEEAQKHKPAYSRESITLESTRSALMATACAWDTLKS